MTSEVRYPAIPGTQYVYDERLNVELEALRQRVAGLRTVVGSLSEPSLARLQEYFRLKNIYNSNAIEGNTLTLGETKMVIQQGFTITGKPLRDTIEAQNLAKALDFFETLANREGDPIHTQDLRNIHRFILAELDERNAGNYRSVFVKISGSAYLPPDPAHVPAMMQVFGAWLETVSERAQPLTVDPIALACAAHAWFVYIHPFIDGNGRTARLLMNLLLLRAGYPLTILTKDDRLRYYEALEESQAGDLTPFMGLVLEAALESIEFYEQAARDQLSLERLLEALVTDAQNGVRHEYLVFEGAMRLLSGTIQQAVQNVDAEYDDDKLVQGVEFKAFGALTFEQYQSIRLVQSAKKTWFMRLAFYHQNKPISVHYVFFFTGASPLMAAHLGANQVSLHVATEVYPSFYEKLKDLPADLVPDILEISYLPSAESFVYLDRDGAIHQVRAEELGKEFIRQGFQKFGGAENI